MIINRQKATNRLRNLVIKLGLLINPVLLKFKQENNQLLVFYFHALYESIDQKNLNHIDPQNGMTVNQFIEFIDYFLFHNYIFIKPDDLLSGLKKDQRYIMLTFDDGYYNNFLTLDILNKYKIPAVFFITAINVKENKSFWWDVVYKYRFKQGVKIEKIRDEQKFLKRFNSSYIDEYVRNNFGADSSEPWSDIDRPLTPDEVKTLIKNPYVSIGNHTYNHSVLINCDEEEISFEFRESNKYLTDLVETIPSCVAFPNGDYNKLVLKVAGETGFRYAFTVEPKKNYFPFEVRKLNCISRFKANTFEIDKYGSFYRLGYSPGSIYSFIRTMTIPNRKE